MADVLTILGGLAASVALVLVELSLVLILHEAAHAREAERLGAEPVAFTVGKGPILFTGASWMKWILGLQETEFAVRRWPSGGYCGHEHIDSRPGLERLYGASLRRSRLSAALAFASWLPGLVCVALLHRVSVWGSNVVALTWFMLPFPLLADWLVNRRRAKGTRNGEEILSDGYVVHALRAATYMPPDTKRAHEVLADCNGNPRFQGVYDRVSPVRVVSPLHVEPPGER